MPQASNVSIFVPVLVLVVIEVSQAAREIDLKSIAERKQEPFFYSVFYLLDQSSQDLIRVPQLGPFNFIHGMNLGILFLGYALVIATSQGSTQLITALIVWLFWVLFPILEVGEYVLVMDDPNVGPLSFLFHSIVTTVAAVVISQYEWVMAMFSVEELVNPISLVYILAVVLLFYIDLMGFLSFLEAELENVDSSLQIS